LRENDVSNQAYVRIAESVDRGVQTAPKEGEELSPAFIAYLGLVYKPEEAELVQHLEMMGSPRTAQDVADASGQDAAAVDEVLSALAEKGFLTFSKGAYTLPAIPNLVNLHMFYPDMKPDDLKAAELYQQFFIKDQFYKYYGTSGKGTPSLRSIPVEHAIHPEEKILSGEEAHAHIKGLDTEDLALVPCPCRTRTEKMGTRECKDDLPVASCIFIDATARLFEKLGLGKRVTKQQALDYLDEMVESGLIPTAHNSLADPHSIMCLCCGCCCSNVRGRTRWDNPTAVLPSQFVPVATDDCIQCETCIDRCFLGALSMDEDAERPVVDTDKCIGCGVCTITCQTDSLKLHRFERPDKPFENRVEFGLTVARDNERL
jgi:Pyruvate/2-oxoacid:ferredoxin oxidoreductase delta subunit